MVAPLAADQRKVYRQWPTNARVTIRQNGYVISEPTVAPGAFEITDLNLTSDNGDRGVLHIDLAGKEARQCTTAYDLKPREKGQSSTALETLNAACR